MFREKACSLPMAPGSAGATLMVRRTADLNHGRVSRANSASRGLDSLVAAGSWDTVKLSFTYLVYEGKSARRMNFCTYLVAQAQGHLSIPIVWDASRGERQSVGIGGAFPASLGRRNGSQNSIAIARFRDSRYRIEGSIWAGRHCPRSGVAASFDLRFLALFRRQQRER
jgi:hypothetical protein